MQAVGATQPGVHGESKGIKTPLLPAPPLRTTNRQLRRRVCALQIRESDAVCCLASLSAHWSMRRFSFVGHGSSGYCLRKRPYMLPQTCTKSVVFPLRIDLLYISQRVQDRDPADQIDQALLHPAAFIIEGLV